jgi:hypothetical protein
MNMKVKGREEAEADVLSCSLSFLLPEKDSLMQGMQ